MGATTSPTARRGRTLPSGGFRRSAPSTRGLVRVERLVEGVELREVGERDDAGDVDHDTAVGTREPRDGFGLTHRMQVSRTIGARAPAGVDEHATGDAMTRLEDVVGELVDAVVGPVRSPHPEVVMGVDDLALRVERELDDCDTRTRGVGRHARPVSAPAVRPASSRRRSRADARASMPDANLPAS